MYNEHVVKDNFIEGLQHSIHQSVRLYWISNKIATVEDLNLHAISLINFQNGSHLGKRTHNSDKTRSRRDYRRSQEAATVYRNSDETLNSPLCGTTGKQKATPVMILPYPRHQEASNLKSSPSHSTTVASSAERVTYCL